MGFTAEEAAYLISLDANEREAAMERLEGMTSPERRQWRESRALARRLTEKDEES